MSIIWPPPGDPTRPSFVAYLTSALAVANHESKHVDRLHYEELSPFSGKKALQRSTMPETSELLHSAPANNVAAFSLTLTKFGSYLVPTESVLEELLSVT